MADTRLSPKAPCIVRAVEVDGSHRETVPWDSSCGVPQLAQLGESSGHSGSCTDTPEVTSSGCHGDGQLLLVNIPML